MHLRFKIEFLKRLFDYYMHIHKIFTIELFFKEKIQLQKGVSIII